MNYRRNGFRRNMDEDLRALDRAWRASNKSDDTALQRLNAARQRAGLPQIGVPAFQLQWGYQAGVPDVETTAWGRRSILERYRDNISIGTHYSATHGNPQAVAELIAILNDGLLASAETEVRRLVRAGRMDRSESKEFFLAEGHDVIILGNAYDYLRLVAFVTPEVDASGDPFERPTLRCEICQKTRVDFGDTLCGKCHARICDDCLADNACENCENIINCVRCKSNLTCSASNCVGFICNSPDCIENAAKCEMCPTNDENLLCPECGEENKMCSQCSEATCSVCDETLFSDDGSRSNKTKSCDNCDELMHYACRKDPCKCERVEEDGEDEDEEDEENDEENDEVGESRRNPDEDDVEDGLDYDDLDEDDEDDLELGGWAVIHQSGDLIADGFESQGEAKDWLKNAIQEGLLEGAIEEYHITETED